MSFGKIMNIIVRRDAIMCNFYKVTVRFYGSSDEVIFISSAFYGYSIDKYRINCESRGLKTASYTPEPIYDPELIEAIKINERDYPPQLKQSSMESCDYE